MGGDHVGEADHGGHALGLAGVVALDRLGDAGVDAPAPGEDAADERVVDAELAALLGDPLVGGGAAAVEALGIAGMEARQHRPADVVEDRGEGELVAVADAAQLGDPVGGPLHVEGVEAETVGGEGEAAVPIEDVVGGSRAQDRLDRTGAEPLDPVRDAADAPPALELAGRPDDRAGEADVGLDHGGDLVRRRPAVHLLERLIAALRRAGWRSASSKAAARTRPRPSPRVPFWAPRVVVAVVAMGYPSAPPGRLFSPCVDLHGRSVAASVESRSTARSIRSRERSLPSTESDSKIPGETEVPVIATRIGW